MNIAPWPWRVSSESTYVVEVDEDGDYLAHISLVGRHLERGEPFALDEAEAAATARLISAAPELLLALKRIMSAVEGDRSGRALDLIDEKVWRDAESAIRKAGVT